ncbi:MAG: peptidylprolyl isomerase [Deltaproteobacteria bacterium]|nr:peptidylprolyl isomerase [Deltaproteobacteria bacterium]
MQGRSSSPSPPARLAAALPAAGLVLGLALGVGGASCSSGGSAPAVTADAGGLEDVAPAPEASTDAGTDVDATPPPPPLEYYADGPLAGCVKDPGPPATPVVTIKDPTGVDDPAGDATKFTLDMALAGYPKNATGDLYALVTTEKGTIKCSLTPSVAPVTVANFIGLARGTRPFDDGTTWVAKRFYDGLLWHRVVPDFVVQGGDPKGTGTGGPGYDLVVENHVAEPLGTLAMAAGATPSGSQFYIVVGNGPPPEYNVFGTCETAVAIEISKVERSPANKPLTPIHMQRIDIARCPAK